MVVSAERGVGRVRRRGGGRDSAGGTAGPGRTRSAAAESRRGTDTFLSGCTARAGGAAGAWRGAGDSTRAGIVAASVGVGGDVVSTDVDRGGWFAECGGA